LNDNQSLNLGDRDSEVLGKALAGGSITILHQQDLPGFSNNGSYSKVSLLYALPASQFPEGCQALR
jgi:hypothetical protein